LASEFFKQLGRDKEACRQVGNEAQREMSRWAFLSNFFEVFQDEYKAPRKVVAASTGSAPGEFERHGEGSFCCGAGGGRMWMEEHSGTRINLERVREALKQEPETVCVSCPNCMTMFEDGLKDAQAATVKVRDIAEVLAETFAPQRA
jgi:Fe-S oxidoreductase